MRDTATVRYKGLAGGIRGISVPSAHFSYEPKTTLKAVLRKKKKEINKANKM